MKIFASSQINIEVPDKEVEQDFRKFMSVTEAQIKRN